MKHEDKAKEQLMSELAELPRQIAGRHTLETEHDKGDETSKLAGIR